MKKLILLLVLVGGLTSCASVKTGNVPAVKDYVENTKSKNENYVAANEWMVEHFVSAKDVVQFADKESGTVKGKYTLLYRAPVYVGYGASTPERHSQAIITVKVKDNGANIVVAPNNLYYVQNEGYNFPTLKGYGIKIKKLITSFKTYMEE